MKTNINGINLGYEVSGQKGYPVVLMHGFGLDRSIWLVIAERYLQDYFLILPDIRGHGESDSPMGTYSMDILAEDVAQLLEFLGIEKAILGGHSMGGYICLAFAEKYPEKLSGLALIATRAYADSELKRAGRFETIEEVKKHGTVVVAESLTPRLTFDADIRNIAYAITARTNPQGIIGSLRGMAERPDRMVLLPEITVPTLVAAGEEDQLIDLDEAKHMADALPSHEFLVMPGSGHMPMLENPEILAKGLISLIETVEQQTLFLINACLYILHELKDQSHC